MDVIKPFKFVAPLILLLPAGMAMAQDATDDAADVILIIEEQWEAEQKGEKDWLDEMLHPGFSGWQKDAPAPRSKSSTKLWNRFADTQGQMLSLIHI